jgi:hypothetical protein
LTLDCKGFDHRYSHTFWIKTTPTRLICPGAVNGRSSKTWNDDIIARAQKWNASTIAEAMERDASFRFR